MKPWLLRHSNWLLPILFFGLFAPFSPYLDRTLARYFYFSSGPGFPETSFLDFLYVYGLIPGQALVVLSGAALVLSFLSKKTVSKDALFLFLSVIVGSVLITHLLLKDHWGRPRPKQVIEFGGAQEFRPFYQPNFFHQPEPSKSFPCGHCSMGFCFFSLYTVGKRRGLLGLKYAGLALACILGSLLGYARMAQGGHFLSDVLMSALVMWLSALWIESLIYERRR